MEIGWYKEGDALMLKNAKNKGANVATHLSLEQSKLSSKKKEKESQG